MGATLVGVNDPGDGQTVSAEIEGHGHIKTDLLVCADGAQSPTRRRLLPDVQSIYAGYVAWRGTLDEADAPELVRFSGTPSPSPEARSSGHILTYFIPGAGADTTPGRRRLNWVWYVAADQDELGPLLMDRDGRQRTFAAARWHPTNDRAGPCRSRPARGSSEARRTRGSNA